MSFVVPRSRMGSVVTAAAACAAAVSDAHRRSGVLGYGVLRLDRAVGGGMPRALRRIAAFGAVPRTPARITPVGTVALALGRIALGGITMGGLADAVCLLVVVTIGGIAPLRTMPRALRRIATFGTVPRAFVGVAAFAAASRALRRITLGVLAALCGGAFIGRAFSAEIQLAQPRSADRLAGCRRCDSLRIL